MPVRVTFDLTDRGIGLVRIEIPDGVKACIASIINADPSLEETWNRSQCMRDGEVVTRDTELQDGDRIEVRRKVHE